MATVASTGGDATRKRREAGARGGSGRRMAQRA